MIKIDHEVYLASTADRHRLIGTKKWVCPQCHQRTFVCYLRNGEVIDPSCGRCDRENNCGYHYTPREYYKDNAWHREGRIARHSLKHRYRVMEQPKVEYIPKNHLVSTMNGYEHNTLVHFLYSHFPAEHVDTVLQMYFVGTYNGTGLLRDSTIFWQVDKDMNVRYGKVMAYESDGHRKKTPQGKGMVYNYASLIHHEYHYKQCLFGEHLLIQYPDTHVCIVESEKTAVICSITYHEYNPAECIWLATGSKGNLSYDMCRSLRGRMVILQPDQGAYDKWAEIGRTLTMCDGVWIDDIMERAYEEGLSKEGDDLADLIFNYTHEVSHEAKQLVRSTPAQV